jgi:hypothetical protein
MSLDAGPGRWYSCLGVLLLLGTLTICSSAVAQSPSLPYDPADIQLKIQKSMKLQREALQSLTDPAQAERLTRAAWTELRAAQHGMILNATRAKFVDPLFEMNNRRAAQALDHLLNAGDLLAAQKKATASREDQEEKSASGSRDGARLHLEQAVRLTNGLAF